MPVYDKFLCVQCFTDPQVTLFYFQQLVVIVLFNGFLIGFRMTVSEPPVRWGELTFGILELAFLVLFFLFKSCGRLDAKWEEEKECCFRARCACWCRGECCGEPATCPWFVSLFFLSSYLGVLMADVLYTLVLEGGGDSILDVLTLLSLVVIYFSDFFRPLYVQVKQEN